MKQILSLSIIKISVVLFLFACSYKGNLFAQAEANSIKHFAANNQESNRGSVNVIVSDNYPDIIDEVAEAGDPYLVCADTPIGSVDEVKKLIDTLNKASEAAKKAGIVLAYHNHDKEFQSLDGKRYHANCLCRKHKWQVSPG